MAPRVEANANKYTFVWGKSIKHSKANMVRQLDELWRYTPAGCPAGAFGTGT